jgi:glycosidase
MASIAAKGRDNSRPPFQWNNTLFAGFSNHQPWLSVNPNYLQINAKNEMENPFGIYHYTKTLFEIRKKYDVFTTGDFTLLYPDDDKTFIYLRGNKSHTALIVTNMTDQEVVVDLENL